ncbi:4-hydroxythreonine-4-phosphate dehydrogenase PdxA [Pseudarthrobacter sp. CC4]|uniref:4-hydroxythreonine-4-phosphate dehydrogenase PdxA n=1 Tax=Pseudarthrobacter sp. CC4 TaxID=3029190 RepID=UPI003B9DCCAE
MTGTEEVSMMLSTTKIRVIHVTTHIGLMDAIRKINPDLVERTIRRGHEALVLAGNPEPQDRRVRHQPARRRERLVRPGRGSGEDRAGCEGCAG